MLALAKCDSHFVEEEKFGHVGNRVRIEGEVFVACQVIGAAPHTACPFYQASAARNERERRQRLVESGEFGQREDLGRERLGFKFADVKEVRVTRLRVKTDTHLCKLAYDWKVGRPSEAKVEQDRKNSEEGEWVAAERRAEEFRIQKEMKKGERKARREEGKARRSELVTVIKEEKVRSQFDTHEKEVRRTGWVLPPGGGLKGGAPGPSSRVSTFWQYCESVTVFECYERMLVLI